MQETHGSGRAGEGVQVRRINLFELDEDDRMVLERFWRRCREEEGAFVRLEGFDYDDLLALVSLGVVQGVREGHVLSGADPFTGEGAKFRVPNIFRHLFSRSPYETVSIRKLDDLADALGVIGYLRDVKAPLRYAAFAVKLILEARGRRRNVLTGGDVRAMAGEEAGVVIALLKGMGLLAPHVDALSGEGPYYRVPEVLRRIRGDVVRVVERELEA